MENKEKLAKCIEAKIASLEEKAYHSYKPDASATIQVAISNLYIALAKLTV